MEYKTYKSYLLKADAAQGVVESIVAVMGNEDLGGDVIWPGAFSKTITESMSKIRVLDQHRTDSVMRVIGKPLVLRELRKDELPPELVAQYPKATGALYAKTQYLMDTAEGAGAFARIAAGAIDEYSIGYDPLPADTDYSMALDSNGKRHTIRNLRALKLYEYSPVLWGMNTATTTLSAKSASGAAGLPLADRARAWDAGAAEGRVRSWADATDAPNAKYGSAFFWVDSSAKDNFTSYKLQFADVIDGKLTAVPRGVFAVAAVLQGSRGGVDIPAGDKDTVKSKVNAYYARMRKEFDDDSIVAPWEGKQGVMGFYWKSVKPWNVFKVGDKWEVYKLDADGNRTGEALGSHDTEEQARAQVRALYANEGKSINLTSAVQEVTEAFMEQFSHSMDSMFMVRTVFDDHVIVCAMNGMGEEYYSVPYSVDANGEIVFVPKSQWIEGDMVFAPIAGEAAGTAMETHGGVKAGRIFAGRNEARLRAILKLVNEALSELDKPDDEKPADETSDNKSQPVGPETIPPTDSAAGTAYLAKLIDIELEQINLFEE